MEKKTIKLNTNPYCKWSNRLSGQRLRYSHSHIPSRLICSQWRSYMLHHWNGASWNVCEVVSTSLATTTATPPPERIKYNLLNSHWTHVSRNILCIIIFVFHFLRQRRTHPRKTCLRCLMSPSHIYHLFAALDLTFSGFVPKKEEKWNEEFTEREKQTKRSDASALDIYHVKCKIHHSIDSIIANRARKKCTRARKPRQLVRENYLPLNRTCRGQNPIDSTQETHRKKEPVSSSSSLLLWIHCLRFHFLLFILRTQFAFARLNTNWIFEKFPRMNETRCNALLHRTTNANRSKRNE